MAYNPPPLSHLKRQTSITPIPKNVSTRSRSISLGHSNPESAKVRLFGILKCETLKCCDGTSSVIVDKKSYKKNH
ncbi:unnamed protein product, partial [Callosobruchus maculatus]